MSPKVSSFRALLSLVSVLISFVTIFSMADTIAVSAYPTRSVGLSTAIVTEAGNQLVLVKDKKAKEFSCKKAKCDPGEVKLDKPNIYGACCQTGTAPLTPKTTPAEPEKCKFPGEVGTPPNCTCPSGTEFMGYKGCVKKVVQRVCCTGIHGNTGGKTGPSCRDTEAAARESISDALINGVPVTSITCAPEK